MACRQLDIGKNFESTGRVAADIESLIRQALARQNGFDPRIRAGIYQSSRNALAKMIAKSGLVPPEVIKSRNAALENTILKIECEFTAEVPPGPTQTEQNTVENSTTTQIPPPGQLPPRSSPQNPHVPPQVSPPNPPLSIPPSFGSDSGTVGTPKAGLHPQAHRLKSISPETGAPEPVAIDQGRIPQMNNPQGIYAEPTPQYARPRRQPIRYVIWLTAIAIFAVVGWVAYTLTMEFLGSGNSPRPPGQLSSSDNTAASGKFLTILDPAQPGALVTAGNGTADILGDTSQPAIRIMSLRKPESRETTAAPMLLELAPGILKEIAGKKVTVEILAKSGDTGPATFSVSCEFGDLGECGRKRFRIGLQPEAVVFSIRISENYKEGQRAALAINTDVTSAAALSGKGAKIDIIYARIRTRNGN